MTLADFLDTNVVDFFVTTHFTIPGIISAIILVFAVPTLIWYKNKRKRDKAEFDRHLAETLAETQRNLNK